AAEGPRRVPGGGRDVRPRGARGGPRSLAALHRRQRERVDLVRWDGAALGARGDVAQDRDVARVARGQGYRARRGRAAARRRARARARVPGHARGGHPAGGALGRGLPRPGRASARAALSPGHDRGGGGPRGAALRRARHPRAQAHTRDDIDEGVGDMIETKTKRAVAGVIDRGGVYSSRVAAGGGYVFLAGTAIDESGKLAAAARPNEPYETSEAARARAQATYLFESLRSLLPRVGSSIDDICQLEQYVKLKRHADPYFTVVTNPSFMGKARPGGATAQLAGFDPADAAISITGMAIAPNAGAGLVKGYPGEDPAKPSTGLFSPLVSAGPYVFNTFFATDNKTGVHPSAKAEDWNWRGSEIKSEVTFGIQQLKDKLAVAGAGLSDIVSYTLFLTDPGDLFEFDLAFAAAVGKDAPSRTVIPAIGFANPRREGAFGHAENAQRMEIQVRAIRPETGAKKVIVDGPGAGFG